MTEDAEQVKSPVDVLVNDASLSDLEAITNFMQPVYADTYPNDHGIRRDMFENDTFHKHLRDYLETELGNHRTFLLTATLQDHIVGTIGLKFDELDSSRAEIWGFYVSPDLQGRGIGTALWEALNNNGRLQEVKELYLVVAKGSIKAIEFYKSHGFEINGEEEWDWPSWTSEKPKNQYWRMEERVSRLSENTQ